MIRNTLILILPLLSFAVPAVADGSWTARLSAGASALSDSDLVFGAGIVDQPFGTGATFGGAIGYDYAGSPWRSEIEFAYRTADPEGTEGDFASTALMLNGYYSFAASGRWRPYFGAGFGILTEIDFDIEQGPRAGEYSDRGGVAIQVMLGTEYAFDERWSLSGEVRYFDAGTVTLERDGTGSLDADYRTLELLTGLTFRF